MIDIPQSETSDFFLRLANLVDSLVSNLRLNLDEQNRELQKNIENLRKERQQSKSELDEALDCMRGKFDQEIELIKKEGEQSIKNLVSCLDLLDLLKENIKTNLPEVEPSVVLKIHFEAQQLLLLMLNSSSVATRKKYESRFIEVLSNFNDIILSNHENNENYISQLNLDGNDKNKNRFYRFSLSKSAKTKDRKYFKKYISSIRAANPGWILFRDWPQAGEEESFVLMKKSEDSLAQRAAYIATVALSRSLQGAYRD